MSERAAEEGVVLVHDAMHTARCWEDLLPLLNRPAVAVDLPGRGRRPADLASVTLADCVTAVLDDADRAGFDRFILVGHSFGGLITTETAHLRPDRVAALVYVGAAVPLAGANPQRIPSDLPAGPIFDPPSENEARSMFGSDLNDAQWSWHRSGLVSEAVSLLGAPVSSVPRGIPTVYVELGQDVVTTGKLAKELSARLDDGIVHRRIGAGHSVMVSQPAALAAIIGQVANALSLGRWRRLH